MSSSAKRYSASDLIIAGIRDGLNVKYSMKWILRQVTIRTAVAWCVFWSSAAFLVSMFLTDFLGISGKSSSVNFFVFYPLSAVILFLCSPQHKLIANTIQRKIQHVEAKNAAKDKTGKKNTSAAGGDSLGIVELLDELTQSLTKTVFRMLLYYVVLVETMIVGVLPLGIGWIVSIALCSWLYVLNCLFVRWEHYEWSVKRALTEFRLRWLYYLGLGLPFSFLCNAFSMSTNSLLYCILFPFFEIFVLCTVDGDKKGPYKNPTSSAHAEKQPNPSQQQQQPEPIIVPVFFIAEFIVNLIFIGLDHIKERILSSKDVSVHEKGAGAGSTSHNPEKLE